tara:strand:+ start:298 stop:2976 length:2679 start_codon:yes stop_codon:yes gene_type:complete
LFYSIKDLNFKSFFLKDYKKSAIENSSDFYVNLKKYYLNKYKKILEIFKKNNNGLEFANRRSNLIDDVISKSYKNFLLEKKKIIKNFSFSIIATGGYGRGELAPFSDIDILFLHSFKKKNNIEFFVKPILHTLWNLGFKVGYATRSPNECIKYSKKKLDVCTSILESRFIIGEKKIYENLINLYKNKIIKTDGKRFIRAILNERKKRLLASGDSRYLLEPNIKNGKGGLRDLQTLEWIGKFYYKTKKLSDLIQYKILDRNSVKSFIKAKSFYWDVRTHLHIISDRPNEQINFEFQNLISKKLGYKKNKQQSGVEKFMKNYFFETKKVSELIRIYCTAIEEKEGLLTPKKNSKEFNLGDFVIKNKRINFSKEFQLKNYFIKKNKSFFRIIEIAQEKNLDLNPNAIRLILDNAEKIEKKIKDDKFFLISFLKILTSKNKPEKFIKLMNNLGLLGIIIPDFKRITGHIQIGGIHRYTVDEHTLKAIGYINEFHTKKKIKDNILYNTIFSEIISPRILYVAMFFHDLGKGTGRDHSIVSSQIAEKFCSFLEIDQIEKNTIKWLIRNHLLMNKISQKRDLDDKNTIFQFAKKIESLEQLKLLFIFTVADMKATGPVIWNTWNKYPLEQLFLKTRSLFLGSPINLNQKMLNNVKAELSKKKIIHKKNLDFFMNILPKEIYLNNDKERIINYLKIIKKSGKKTFIKINQNKQKIVTELLVYTKDSPGLLYKLSGGVSVSGFNVTEAKVSTLKNGMALDILLIKDLNGEMLDPIYHFPVLEKNIRDSLFNVNLLQKNLIKEKKENIKKNLFKIKTNIFIDNDASNKHTILEINTFDRVGLIYDLTKKLYELGFEISSAKILSMGERANEIFYIQDFNGKKLQSNKKINKLKTSIMSLLKN